MAAECILKNGRRIGSDFEPYVVAEVNSSHNGNLETAKKMVTTVKEIGCDCVKFQSWSTESLYSKSYYDENPIAKRFVKKFAFTLEEQMEIANYCNEIGISFASTPYSKEEVDFLIEKCNVPYIKIASMDVNNYPFIKYIAQTGIPIVLATGMADMEEIHKAVSIIQETGNENLCLLHCISSYPPEIRTIRLKNISGFQKEFPDIAIGFSDHSLGTEMASAAIALGACLIEKHFTLDKTKIGMDNQMATEPDEFAKLITQCHNVYYALGSEERIVQEAELEQRLKMRRSLVVTRDIKAGDILCMEDFDVKRPGNGIEPEKAELLIGKKMICPKEADTILKMEELEIEK